MINRVTSTSVPSLLDLWERGCQVARNNSWSFHWLRFLSVNEENRSSAISSILRILSWRYTSSSIVFEILIQTVWMYIWNGSLKVWLPAGIKIMANGWDLNDTKYKYHLDQIQTPLDWALKRGKVRWVLLGRRWLVQFLSDAFFDAFLIYIYRNEAWKCSFTLV